jgi:hypothetical protein
VLHKITIPAGDRLEALTELSDYNIDEFTLFGTEDALVRSLAREYFEVRRS